MTELREVDHTNPHTGESFGRTQVYDRGTTVVADGGEADAPRAEDDEASEAEQPDAAGADRENLEDVAHTPPREEVGAQGAYERGDRDTSDDE